MAEQSKTHPLTVGARVYHYGHQWSGAEDGTATIVEVKPQRDGTSEYRVQLDRPLYPGGPEESWWASYHTYKAIELAPLSPPDHCPDAEDREDQE